MNEKKIETLYELLEKAEKEKDERGIGSPAVGYFYVGTNVSVCCYKEARANCLSIKFREDE